MPIEVVMPAMEMAQETARLVSWLKAEGERVLRGEPLMEIETDKVRVEIEAVASGILSSIRVKPGDDIATGTVIALLLAEGEPEQSAPEFRAFAPPAQTRQDVVVAVPPPDSARDDGRLGLTPASPKARRLAAEHGIELGTIEGSGPGEAVLTADVVRQLNLPGSAGRPSGEEYSVVVMAGMRKTIADRTQRSYQAAPHISLSLSIDMTETLRLHDFMKGSVKTETGLELTMTAVLARVISLTLRHHPRLNAHLAGDEIHEYRTVHLGIAVALQEGLIVPVIHHAEQKRLAQLQIELHDLVDRARAGRLERQDVSGGTFTLSNLGMFEIESFTAIVHPPQVGIASVGVIQDVPVGRQGQIVLRAMMRLTVNVDHRAVDGAVAAAFLQQLKRGLENPYDILA